MPLVEFPTMGFSSFTDDDDLLFSLPAALLSVNVCGAPVVWSYAVAAALHNFPGKAGNPLKKIFCLFGKKGPIYV